MDPQPQRNLHFYEGRVGAEGQIPLSHNVNQCSVVSWPAKIMASFGWQSKGNEYLLRTSQRKDILWKDLGGKQCPETTDKIMVTQKTEVGY